MTLRDRHTPGRERAGDPFAGAEDGPLPDVGGGAYAPSVRSATTTFRGHPASVPAARRWVVATLAEWGLQATGWAAAQIVSELATNCTLHARSDFTVRVALDSTCLRIEAEDASPVALQSRAYSATSTTGRGLGIVDVLAREWGVTSSADGKTVWVLLAVDSADASPPEGDARRPGGPGGHGGPDGGQIAPAGRGAAA